jgi:hypothetical protein
MPRKNNITFSFASKTGDFIGQGRTESYTPVSTQFTVKQNSKNSVCFGMEYERGYWNLEFAAPKGERLRAQVYMGATRYPFQADNAPGICMSGNGRCANRSFGQFEIERIQFSKTGDLVLFQAEFTLHSERPEAPGLTGNIYYYQKPQKTTTIPVGEKGIAQVGETPDGEDGGILRL